MKLSKLHSRSLWKDSCSLAISLIATIETICAIADFTITDLISIPKWWARGLLILFAFLLLCVVVAVVKAVIADRRITLKVKGITVNIKEGDIFDSSGWKLIPFNEFFDTTVDDVIIARNSLNGEFINRLQDKDDLLKTIEGADDISGFKRKSKAGRMAYPLGRIITYKDYLLLAFSHFENNQAKLSHNDYEMCLRAMWNEISRVYAHRPVTLPLLGGGITRISDKNETQLLRCMLCTLKTSNAQIYQPITIILTREALDRINLYNIKITL